MIGRTHGIHAEPTTFGHKLAVWVAQMRRDRKRLDARPRRDARSARSPARSAPTPTCPPELEERVCDRLGLRPDEAGHPDRAARPPRPVLSTLAVIAATLEQQAHRDPLPAAHRDRRGGRAVLRRPAGLVADAPQTQPRAGRAGLRPGARWSAATPSPALDNVALWHERDISHSSAERIIFPDACLALDYMLRIFADDHRRPGRLPRARWRATSSRRAGLIYSRRVLLALVESGHGRQRRLRARPDATRKRSGAARATSKSLLAADPASARPPERATSWRSLSTSSYHLRGIESALRAPRAWLSVDASIPGCVRRPTAADAHARAACPAAAVLPRQGPRDVRPSATTAC